MLHKGDKIVAKKNIGSLCRAGDVVTVIEVRPNGDFRFFGVDGVTKGTASQDMFDKYFEMYNELEQSEQPKKNTITLDMVEDILDDSEFEICTMFDKCTVVSCRLPNGFVIVEYATCVDPDDYDEAEGFEECLDRITDKIWELEGYKLQDDLADTGDDDTDDDDDFDACENCEYREECDMENRDEDYYRDDEYDDDDDFDDDDYYARFDKKFSDFLSFLDDAYDDYMHGM